MSLSERGKQFRALSAVLVIGFLVGFIPMWLKGRQRTSERDEALRTLQRTELKSQLAEAALEARRAHYETARQELSRFFTSLNGVVAGKNNRDITPQQLQSLQPLYSQRDELITLLARSDPASADRLSDLDLAFRKALR
ncbi:MAG: hypothetical protein ACJ74Z_04720 [Bryobacteraceae bacterium]